MNYFNIDVNSDLLNEYLRSVDKNIVGMIKFDRSTVDDIVRKVEVFNPIMYDKLFDKIKEYEAKQRMKLLVRMFPNGNSTNYGLVDPQNMDKALLRVGTIQTTPEGKKLIEIVSQAFPPLLGGGRTFSLYSYPEYDKASDTYVMRPV